MSTQTRNNSNKSKKKYAEYTADIATQTADKLKECRKSKDISRAKLERMCLYNELPVKYSTMIDFELPVYEKEGKKERHSVRGMSLSTFYTLCEFYNVSADYLLGFKESKHRESSSDYAIKEWGFTDESLQTIKELKQRTVAYYKNIKNEQQNKPMTGIDFLNIMLTKFIQNFEHAVIKYFEKLDELDEFKSSYTNPKTGLLNFVDEDKEFKKLKGATDIELIKEYIYTSSVSYNNNIEMKIEDLELEAEELKFKISKIVEQLLKEIKSELSKTTKSE